MKQLSKLKRHIKTFEDLNVLKTVLMNRLLINSPISNNGMLDGLIIGFIVNKDKYVFSLLRNQNLGRVLDGTIQQLEQIVIWMINNQDSLCQIMKEEKTFKTFMDEDFLMSSELINC